MEEIIDDGSGKREPVGCVTVVICVLIGLVVLAFSIFLISGVISGVAANNKDMQAPPVTRTCKVLGVGSIPDPRSHSATAKLATLNTDCGTYPVPSEVFNMVQVGGTYSFITTPNNVLLDIKK